MSDVDPPAPQDLAPREENGVEKRLRVPVRTDWMRQIHHIRKQEFAYLRSVQEREASGGEPALAGFRAASPSMGTVREDTIKKIDEIEARLNLQWVASSPRKQAEPVQVLGGPFNPSVSTAPSSNPLTALGTFTQVMYDEEMPSSVLLVDTVDTFPPRTTHTPATAAPDHGPAQVLPPTPLRTSKTQVQADKVLATVGVLFAHGENDLAAQHLLRAVRSNSEGKALARRWLLALLEIYRATGNQAQFDWSVLEYFDYWDGVTPQWRSASTAVAPAQTPVLTNAAPSASFAESGMDQAVVWRCPSTLSRTAARDLKALWRTSSHCALDWTSLSTIEADAAADLSEFFNTTDQGPLQLVFFDTPNLLYVLDQATPQGQALVKRSLWDLRFCFLKLMHMRVAFDAATADFCLTYIEDAPVWQPGRARFDSDALAAPAAAITPDASAFATPWRLHGQLLGAQSIELPEPASGSQQNIITIACEALVRMDDAATAQLVQWAQTAAMRGAEVHFADVSLLVAAVWESAGLNAHAQVSLRDPR
ncbi:MAG: hypothetical protein QE279_07695 [Rhodoferax sp.]|nr:hypothetical protein [Rhodoferax sp.]